MNALKRKIAGVMGVNTDAEEYASSLSDSKDLQAENQHLSRQLKAFVAKVRQNEEKLKRFQALELNLISCTTLTELFRTVTLDYRTTSKLDQVVLTLYDPEYEIRRILEEDDVDYEAHPDLKFTDQRKHLEQFFNLRARPVLGPYNAITQSVLFSEDAGRTPASVALIPMLKHGEIIGCLSLGSVQPERFIRGTASDFLERFTNIAAVCLQNVKNNEQLKRVGLTDVLTNLNNRRFFDQRLQEEVSAVQRSQSPLSCLFFDVDHFKKINDQYGHQAGDVVLREVAAIIRQSLRTTDILARYGGEEFAALLPHTDQSTGLEIAERIRSSIASTSFQVSEETTIRVTISIGLSTAGDIDIGGDPHKLGLKLVQRADDQLYLAKRSGRNRVMGETSVERAAELEI